MKQYIQFAFFIVAFIFSFLFLKSPAVAATVDYPIPALGNCANARECKLYCNIPANTPACWSYEKYVMHTNVLGETDANITYPITELGNCATATECFIYCNQPQNQSTCLSFARKNGLVKETIQTEPAPPEGIMEAAKTELGCDSRDACMALCSDGANIDKCRAFAQKHKLDRPDQQRPAPQVMQKAKSELGCDSETSCMKYCDNPQNRQKCFEFAKKNNLIHEDEVKNIEEMRENKKKMLEAAKTGLGCNSYESCHALCMKQENTQKCSGLGKKYGILKQGTSQESSTPPCTSSEECKKYCEVNPTECPGMSGRPNTNASDTALNKPSTMSNQKGDFLGPSGCRTEDECRAYCEKHPSECPGFPKKEQQSQNTFMKPQISPSQNYQTTSGTNDGYKPPINQYINPPPNSQNSISGSNQLPPTNQTQNYPPPNPSGFPQ